MADRRESPGVDFHADINRSASGQWWVYLALIISFFFAIKTLALIGVTSLSDPELRTVMKSFQSSISQLFKILNKDVHPPLYYLVVMAAGRIWGETATLLRLISWIFYVGASLLIGYAAWLDRRNYKSAAIALLLAFSSPFLCQYAIEAKAYEMTALLIAAALVFRIQYCRPQESESAEHPSQRLWLYALMLASAGLSHYYGLFLVGSLAVADAFAGRKPLALSALAAVLPASLYMITNLSLLVRGDKVTFLRPPDWRLFEELGTLLFGQNFAMILLFAGLILTVLAWRSSRPPGLNFGGAIAFIVDYGIHGCFLLLLGTLAISFVRPMADGRFYIVIVPAMIAGLAACLGRSLEGPRQRASTGFILLLFLAMLLSQFWTLGYSVVDPYRHGRFARKNDDYRSVSLLTSRDAYRLSPQCPKLKASDWVLMREHLMPDAAPWICFRTLDPNLMSKDDYQLAADIYAQSQVVFGATGRRGTRDKKFPVMKGVKQIADQERFLVDRGFKCNWRVRNHSAGVLSCVRSSE